MTPPNNPHHTRTVPANAAGMADAAALIAAGACVAVPTETVYGLAADATRADAVARIFAAKGRPAFNPLIVHVASLADAEAFALFDDRARSLAERFWPGPLTLVLPAQNGSPITGAVTAGLPTLAVRVPAHPVMRALLVASGRPLAAPSANASGCISPTRAEHVLASLAGRIPLVIDGGPTEAGLESTIVALTDDTLRLLRPGPISGETLGHTAHELPDRIEAPGQLARHYQPRKPLSLNRVHQEVDTWLIGFGTVEGNANLSSAGDLSEAATRLYAALHDADASDRARIAVAPIPFEGIGAAINDRLARAAAP